MTEPVTARHRRRLRRVAVHVEAAVVLSGAQLAIRFLPARRVTRLLGTVDLDGGPEPPAGPPARPVVPTTRPVAAPRRTGGLTHTDPSADRLVRMAETTAALDARDRPEPPAGGRGRPAVARRARPVGRAVDRMARLLPWHPTCLPQAVATAFMLRRRGIECRAHLGVVSRSPFGAHAWVTVAGAVVQGGSSTGITELAAFSGGRRG